jgi:ABC-type Zn uptake system ZnuABC Zn-binding protein ZnuA
MKTALIFACTVLILLMADHGAEAKIKIVASTTDLASIAAKIGGDRVEVRSIAKGTADPHYVEVLPSYMIRVAKADIYLKVGLDLDRWANEIIDGSRNSRLIVVDCSTGIEPLEKPTTRVDASMGDVHPRGNPHYWLDPSNGVLVAEKIYDALTRTDGENRDYYAGRLDTFRAEFAAKSAHWTERAKKLAGTELITYHNSWPYFSRAFGLKVAGYVEPKPGIEPTASHTVEPKPGIEPTASHTARIVEMVNAKSIRIIGVEPYFSRRAPDSIARMTDATVVILPPSVGGADGADDYWSLFDTILDILETAAGN